MLIHIYLYRVVLDTPSNVAISLHVNDRDARYSTSLQLELQTVSPNCIGDGHRGQPVKTLYKVFCYVVTVERK